MKKLSFFFLIFTSLFAKEPEFPYQPWFTGPLIAPTVNTLAPGEGNLQPYLTYTIFNGEYDNHHHFIDTPNEYTWQLFSLLQFGLFKRVDLEIIPKVFWSRKQGSSAVTFGDLPVILGIKLSDDIPHTPIFESKLALIELFPTGKYQNLNPNNNGTDSSGLGSYQSSIGWFSQKIVYWWPAHPIRWRWAFQYTFGTSVHVSGANTYGGARDTMGKIHPGNTTQIILSGEFSFTQNWVGAFDMVYLFTEKTTFQGNPGTKTDGTPAEIGSPVSWQWSFAPALEYNFNERIGLISGVWFTFAGKNSESFISGQISINYAFPAKSSKKETAKGSK